jgi:hypothetical protein
LLRDNDGYWSGVLRREGSEQSFRLRMLRQGEAVTAALVSDFDPSDPEGMRGVGAIPPGVWDLTSASMTTNTFRAVSSPIPMGTSTLFGESALNRVLSFDSSPAPGPDPSTNYLFKPNLIIGTYTDRLDPASEDLQYLARETAGLFVLMQELPVLPLPDLPSVAPTLAAVQDTEVSP